MLSCRAFLLNGLPDDPARAARASELYTSLASNGGQRANPGHLPCSFLPSGLRLCNCSMGANQHPHHIQRPFLCLLRHHSLCRNRWWNWWWRRVLLCRQRRQLVQNWPAKRRRVCSCHFRSTPLRRDSAQPRRRSIDEQRHNLGRGEFRLIEQICPVTGPVRLESFCRDWWRSLSIDRQRCKLDSCERRHGKRGCPRTWCHRFHAICRDMGRGGRRVSFLG